MPVPQPEQTAVSRSRVLVVFGTRPEAIKMAPVVRAIDASPALEAVCCVTAQHREMLDQALRTFDLIPAHDLDLMRPGQGLSELTARVLGGMRGVIEREAPAAVLVQGDTTTTMATALAAFYAGVPVGHVEAGLRTGDIRSPWPEEMNRRVATVLADFHFAPTAAARDRLLGEGVPADAVTLTGNTVIDALLSVRDRLNDPNSAESAEARAALPFLDDADPRRVVLVTCHRRESFGAGLERILDAVRELARRPDVLVVLPVHLNPAVSARVRARLSGHDRVVLTEPQPYIPFVRLMSRSRLILTDSGGVQEEAPSLGVPVLVMRETTERREGIDAGTSELVGTDPDRIVRAAERLLDDPDYYESVARRENPYGDGGAGARIAKALESALREASTA